MRKSRFLSALAARPNLTGALLTGLAGFALTPWDWRLSTKALIGWDVCVLVYLGLMVVTMNRRVTAADMTRRSARLDQGRGVVLVMNVLATVVALAAVAVEAVLTKHDPSIAPAWRAGFSALTVILSWLFVHTVFAIHYAHDFYGRACDVRRADLVVDEDATGTVKDGGGREDPNARRAGLLFPGGDDTPDYWDFVHFAFVIGVASQTADVQIESKSIRRIVTVHGIIAFVFNTGIVALGVNFAASLF
jgi:uncharacterized membrane protein